MLPVRFSCRFLQGDVHVAVRAGSFFPDGVGGKFNVFLAKEAGHFQEIGFAQGDCGLTMRAGNFLAEVAIVKPNMEAAGRTRHFQESSSFRLALFPPKPTHRRITAQQQIYRQDCRDEAWSAA